MESTNNQTPARSSEEQLKAKYGGKLYRVGITVPVDDESEKEFSYYFKRPTVPSYDRYIKTAAQGITKASKAFMLDAVIDEDAERLTKDMEENPGIAISIGSIPGAIIGARLVHRVPERTLRFIFGGFLIVAAALLVLNEFGILG